jgi:hypothetical protein
MRRQLAGNWHGVNDSTRKLKFTPSDSASLSGSFVDVGEKFHYEITSHNEVGRTLHLDLRAAKFPGPVFEKRIRDIYFSADGAIDVTLYNNFHFNNPKDNSYSPVTFSYKRD